MKVLLIGAGGHAKAMVEALKSAGHEIAAYVDTREAAWLQAPRLMSDGDWKGRGRTAVLGFGALVPGQLQRRLRVLDDLMARGFKMLPVVHPSAHVSPAATLKEGVTVLAGAVIQPGVTLGRGVIVNSGAIVEHDSTVDAGTHVAPGAIVLADCAVGSSCMIGANAVVLRGARVPADTLIRAVTLYYGARPTRRRRQKK